MAYKRGHFTCITAIYTLEKACFTNLQADLLDMIKVQLFKTFGWFWKHFNYLYESNFVKLSYSSLYACEYYLENLLQCITVYSFVQEK